MGTGSTSVRPISTCHYVEKVPSLIVLDESCVWGQVGAVLRKLGTSLSQVSLLAGNDDKKQNCNGTQ